MNIHSPSERSGAKRAAIYGRLSADPQNERSIEDQLALCRIFCVSKGLVIVSERSDRLSGGAMHDRKGLAALLVDVTTKVVDAIVVESMDRISRDRDEIANISDHLRSAGVQLLAVKG